MSKTSKRVDRTNKKQKFKTIVIPLIFFIVIIAVVVAVCVSCANRGNNHNTTTPGTTVNVNDYISGEEYLSINEKDCAIYVGDMIKLTCSSYPETYSLGVNWKSSDSSVLTVTYDGMVTAIKTGMAAITATNGVLSSSIIIQVIDENETVQDDFSIHNPETPGTVPDETTAGNIEPSQESTSVQPSAGQEATQENTSGIEETTKSEESTSKPEQETTAAQETTAPSEKETVTEEPPTEESGTIDAREFILYNLPEYGFDNYINDTFVYKEDGNYLGQAIVEQEFTQIYVMTRTTTFDSSIKDLLKAFFPTGYATVFNKFTNATSDTTFYADGYKVRAITSPGGGHRQLIIYY